MTDRRKRVSGLLFALVALGALAVAPATLPAASHVILVSIDGFAAYHLYNQELLLPNIRELIDAGVWAASSETVFPSVTHPSHTTMVTGVKPRRHGVLSNWLVNRKTGEEFHPTNKSRKDVVRVPTIFDAAKAKGLTTAAFMWPETKDDPSIDFNIPEVFTPDRRADVSAVDPKLLDELRGAGVPIDYYFRWFGAERHGAGDAILAEGAAYVIRRYKPNLLALHILVTDKTQHARGPHHYLSQAALTMADYCVGILLDAVKESGIADQTTFIITADHGFHSVYSEVNVRPVFEKAGLLDKVSLHGGGWTIAVELRKRFDLGRDMPALENAFAELRRLKIVRKVVSPDEMHDLGQPRFEESEYARGHYLLIPDIDTHLVADRTSSSTERRPKKKPSHGHGYLPEHPRMYPALVLSGAGIKKGVTIGHTKNLNIAPTIAHLLGLEMNNVSGKVLRDALTE
jgi:predicted AlkP superfamily pyrophosphatase or phosphodiesterase